MVAAIAAGVLGEYEFAGFVPWAAGAVVGYAVAEIVATLGRWRGWVPAALAGAIAAGSILWGGWLETIGGVEPYPALAWAGAAVALVTAVIRLRPLGPTAAD